MARSEAATQIAHRLFTSGRVSVKRLVLEFSEDEHKFRGHAGWSESAMADQIDNELQEVREVLAITSRHKTPDGLCWCVNNLPSFGHIEKCQRARALYQRLKIGD